MKYRIRRRRYVRRSPSYWFVLILIPLLLWLVISCGNHSESKRFLNGETQGSDEISGKEPMIQLLRSESGTITELPLETYVAGVVAAEMPVEFEREALMAQAVIARTYALRRASEVNTDKQHGDLCDDPGHCQAYRSREELSSAWGTSFSDNEEKIMSAVKATAGMVLTYEGNYAETFYHSTCGGKTASAKEVWGEDIPYLQSVACEWDKDAPRYDEVRSVALSDLPWLLGNGTSPCIAVAEGETVSEIPVAGEKTESGRVASVSYAGLTFRGIDFRKALALNSACFSMKVEGNTLFVNTRGFGHGVGLCQYGANGMAQKGYSFQEILSYYYPGTLLMHDK